MPSYGFCIPEIMDTLETARALVSEDFKTNRLYGIRIDTCGENIMEGALPILDKRRLN